MKGTFESLTDFAARVEQVEVAKQDYVVNTEKVIMDSPHSLILPEVGRYELTRHADGQLADRLQVPRKFWERTLGYDGLREQMVHTMLSQKPESRMVRTLEGTARAWLSDRYRPIDNLFVMDAVVPTLSNFPDIKVASTSITDTRMYFQATFPRLEMEVVPGDVVRAGITITNSEVGAGAVNVETLIWRLVCSNGMIGKSLMRSTHIGRRINMDDEAELEVYQNDTIDAEQRSLQLRLRDIVAAALTESAFAAEVSKLRDATKDAIDDTPQTIANVTQRYNLPEAWAEGITRNIYEERNFNRYGVANAITNFAQKLDDRDQQYDMERLGAKIIDATPGEWRELVA